MSIIKNTISIDVPSSWLSQGYYVYVAKIVVNGQLFYYIGQTGDGHYHTARGPLYRMSGHLAKSDSSTQNQLIKGLQNNFPNTDIETILQNTAIQYTFFKIADYDAKDTKEQHQTKRLSTLCIERLLIFRFCQQNSKVFNEAVKTARSAAMKELSDDYWAEMEEAAGQILKEVGYEG